MKIYSSKEIRREFTKKHSNIVIEKYYSTAGGSIYMELESKEAAKWLDNNWDKALFGGNAGLHVAEDDNCVGIIKNVVDFDNLPIPTRAGKASQEGRRSQSRHKE